MSEALESNSVIRPRLLEGLLTGEQLEEETGWRWRTRRRRELEGLPVIVIGGTKLYPIDKVREWILSRVRKHEPPRRGRPRKAAA
jgi:hypothetical protein